MAFTYGTVTNCKTYNGQTRKEYECRLGYEVQSQSIANNTSSVKLKLQVRSISSSYGTYGYNQTTTIDGTALAAKSFDMRSTNTWQTFGERTITVTHNSNGTYSASKSGSFTTTGNSTWNLKSGSASVTVAPATIPRYATSNQSLYSRTSSSITMSWSSDSTIDYVWYSKDNGASWVAVGSVNATSGSYTISGLSSNTTYNIKTRVRRKDSQLTTDSATTAVTTHYTTIPTVSVSSKTETSITVTHGGNVYISYVQFRIKEGNGNYGAYQTSSTFSGLKANTTYTIEVYAVGRDSGEVGYATVSATTYDYPYCTDSPNFVIGSALTLKFYNPLGRTISFSFIANGVAIEDAGWKISGTSYTGVNAQTSTSRFYASIPNATSGKYQVKVVYGSSVRTRNNGNTYSIKGTEYPTFSNFTYEDTNSKTIALTGNNQILVSGYSNLKTTISTANKAYSNYSSPIKKYRLNVGNMSSVEKNYSDSSDVVMEIAKVNSPSITITAIDSRELPAGVLKTASFKSYTKPVIKSMNVARDNGGVGSQVTLSFNGEWWNNNFGKVANAINKIVYYYKKTTDSTWTEGNVVIIPTINGTNFSGSILIEGPNADDKGFDVSTAYNIKMVVTDELDSSTEYQTTLGTGTPAIAIWENKVAIGKKYDEALGGTLQVNGTANIDNFGYTQGFSKNLNDINKTCIVYADSSSVNKPVTNNGYCITLSVRDEYRKQLFYAQSGENYSYERVCYGGNWGEWFKIRVIEENAFLEYPKCLTDYNIAGTNQYIVIDTKSSNLYEMIHLKVIGNGYGVNPIDSIIQGYHYTPAGNLIQCKIHNNSQTLSAWFMYDGTIKIVIQVPSDYISWSIMLWTPIHKAQAFKATLSGVGSFPSYSTRVQCTAV